MFDFSVKEKSFLHIYQKCQNIEIDYLKTSFFHQLNFTKKTKSIKIKYIKIQVVKMTSFFSLEYI